MDYDEAYETLPEKYRVILKMREDSFSYQEIAVRVGLSKQGVAYAERRALEIIGKLLLKVEDK